MIAKQKVCIICGFAKPIEEWAFKVGRLAKVTATAKPETNVIKSSSQQGNIFKILRETVLGYVKIYGKETILPFIEKIYQEAKKKAPEEYFK
jgi:hypothetical protein